VNIHLVPQQVGTKLMLTPTRIECLDTREYEGSIEAPPWKIFPHDLISWWDMKEFQGSKLYVITVMLEGIVHHDLDPLVAQAVLSEGQRSNVESALRVVERECSLCGLGDSVAAVFELRNHLLSIKYFQVTKEQTISRMEELGRAIQRELKRHLFLHIEPQQAHWYQTPAEGWGEVVKRWGSMRDNIEESSKCFACDRYAAAVFHIILVAEAGAIEVGKLIEITDPKPGWNSVLREMGHIFPPAKRSLKPVEQKHFTLLEQLWPLMQGIKHAWRDKISHVENRLVLMTGEFSPQIAEDIIVATRGFMRRLAIDLPTA
jgi:hypothetical protein